MSDTNTDPISDFRTANEAVLFDTAHPMHESKVVELSKLYEAKFNAPKEEKFSSLPAGVANLSTPETTVDMNGTDLIDDAALVSPAVSPDAYQWGPQSYPEQVKTDAGPVGLVMDPEFEKEARGWLHSNEVTPAEGMALEHIYHEELTAHGITDARLQSLEQLTRWELLNQYGDRWQEALSAARKVAQEGGDKLLDFLANTNLGSHPRVVANFIKRAEKLGYFTP
jgi:hypothetical protein